MTSVPLVRVIVPVTAKTIVSPLFAAAIVSRSDPAPLSLRFVTVRVVACTCGAMAQKAHSSKHLLSNLALKVLQIDQKLALL
jgi:hypothetical protein